MVKYCAVKGCKEQWMGNKSVSFFSFPNNNEELKRKWLEAGPGYGAVSKNSAVCSRHFSPEDYTDWTKYGGMRKLKKDAVPSIFDNPSSVGTETADSDDSDYSGCGSSSNTNMTDEAQATSHEITSYDFDAVAQGSQESKDPKKQSKRFNDVAVQTCPKLSGPSEREKELQVKVHVLQERLRRRDRRIDSLKEEITRLKEAGNSSSKSSTTPSSQNTGAKPRRCDPYVTTESGTGSETEDEASTLHENEEIVAIGNSTSLPGDSKVTSTAEATNPKISETHMNDIEDDDDDFEMIEPILPTKKRTEVFSPNFHEETTSPDVEKILSNTRKSVNSVNVATPRSIPALIGYESVTSTELSRQNRFLRLNIAKLTARVKEFQKLNKELNKKFERASNQNMLLRTQVRKPTVEQMLDERNCKSPAARAMVKLQLHKKNATFDADEKDLAMQIFCHSAPAYKRLQKAGCNLPTEGALRLWISEIESSSRPRTVFGKTQSKNSDNDALNLLDYPSEVG